MAWTKYQIFLAVLLVATGSINTLTTKWADQMVSAGSDGVVRHFHHPFVQAVAMFIGEFLCLTTFTALRYYYRNKENGGDKKLVKGNTNYNRLVLLLPAMCDLIATSTMYIGLNLTYASSFQMLRGAVIVFTAILSRIFLKRQICLREWIGICFVIGGLVIVGASDMIGDPVKGAPSTNNIILGDVLIVAAQIIVGIHMVLQEKYVAGLDIPPLQAIGWEGLYGMSVLGLLLIPFYFIQVPPPFSQNAHGVLEDTPDAFVQMGNNGLMIVSLLCTIGSIAFFNFAGISVTKEISATTRMVLDSLRTLIIWVISLAVGWQKFFYLQVVGFVVLLIGMCLYNDVLIMQAIRKIRDFATSRGGKGQKTSTQGNVQTT